MNPTKTVNQGVWVVEKTTALSSLTVAPGASVAAPEGKSLTMTVDGVVTAIKPGNYYGDVCLTVTDGFFVKISGMGGGPKPTEFRCAVLIEDGKYVKGKSVEAAVRGGKITDKAMTGGTIFGTEENFNGIFIDGDSEYTVENLKIDFEGAGTNDFVGLGAGITCVGKSKVTINNCEIKLKSVTRCGIHAGGESVMTVNNSFVSNESPEKEGFLPMWVLGLNGTNRATQACGKATINYNNCHLISNGWGTLSIDGGQHVRMNLKDCKIDLTGPRARGYGAFSIGDAVISYDNCTLNVQGYPMLLGGHNDKSDGVFTNGTVVNSTLYGAMIFKAIGTEVKVDKGTTFNTASSVFVIKGANAAFDIDDTKFNPGNGVVVQLMDLDDPGMTGSRFVPPCGADVPVPGRDLTKIDPAFDIPMNISNSKITGNFYNSTTNLKANCRGNVPVLMAGPGPGGPGGPGGKMNSDEQMGPKNLGLKLTNVKLNGIISAATAAYKESVLVIEPYNRNEINAVTQTAAEPVNNGVIVSLDKDSVWTVAGTSYLTSLTLATAASIKAPGGKTLTMTVDGVEKKIAAGTYTGKIVLNVA